MICRVVIGLETLTDSVAISVADVDGDGEITNADAIKVVRQLIDLVS